MRRRFVRHRLAVVGLVLLGVVVLIAGVGPLVSNLDPYRIDMRMVRQPPSPAHLMGTDLAGRDVLSRVVLGARTSLAVGLAAVALYVALGSLIGAIAGYAGGIVDNTLMRLADAALSFPTLLLIIVFVSIVGPSLQSIVAVIAILGWPGIARLARGQVIALRDAEFVVAARVVGVNDTRILFRHVLTNAVGPLTVLASLGLANTVLLEAALSFLGLGVQPPEPSLGGMINAAQSATVLLQVPWLWIPPAITISVIVLAVNLIGDGLRDALDPRSVQRG